MSRGGARIAGASLARDDQGRKHCKRGNHWLPESEFGWSTSAKDGLQGYCNGCFAEIYRERMSRLSEEGREENRRIERERQRGYCPVKRRARTLKSNYGLTQADYNFLLRLQGGGCAICGSEEASSRRGKNLFVDHDHATGAIRGLLCHPCNAGLGHLRDSPDLLRQAADYLEGRAR